MTTAVICQCVEMARVERVQRKAARNVGHMRDSGIHRRHCTGLASHQHTSDGTTAHSRRTAPSLSWHLNNNTIAHMIRGTQSQSVSDKVKKCLTPHLTNK